VVAAPSAAAEMAALAVPAAVARSEQTGRPNVTNINKKLPSDYGVHG
jgi:hypothetical protein